MNDDVRPGQDRMFRWIAGLPDQLRESGRFRGLAEVAPLASAPAQILVCGMGGSAMAGSLLADGWPGLAAPVLVHRDQGLPPWAGPATLVIACSYSGNTAETLAAVAEARRRGCPVAAVTSGGELLALARRAGLPVVEMPGGQPPRTALGASLGAQLHLLCALGLLPDPATAITAACAQAAAGALVTLGQDATPVGADAARTLAAALLDRFTVIFTAGSEAHGAGRRLLAQLAENAKAPAHVAAFPELNHNEIVGWDLPRSAAAGFALVTLRGGDEDPAQRDGVDVALDLLRDQFAVQHTVHAYGSGRLARIVGLILFGDLVSAHLAVLAGKDPVPITRIDTLKSRLAGR
ncbi:MAG: SIS domain-containing protein [Candidatus Krumholzibacteriia bacterium]